MKIRDVMTTDIRSADLDSTLEAIATIMRDEDVGAVQIVDDGELCGIAIARDSWCDVLPKAATAATPQSRTS